LFLFSGSIFYAAEDGRLQVQRISWEKECVYRMPLGTWQELMDRHYPNTAWLSLRRDVFDRLCEYKRAGGFGHLGGKRSNGCCPEVETVEAMA